MRLDEARQHDHAAPVDRRRARRLEAWPDRDDGAVRHMHVAIGDVAGVVHGHDIGVADDEVAARR